MTAHKQLESVPWFTGSQKGTFIAQVRTLPARLPDDIAESFAGNWRRVGAGMSRSPVVQLGLRAGVRGHGAKVVTQLAG